MRHFSSLNVSERCGFQVGKGTDYENIELSNIFYICPSHPIAHLDRVAYLVLLVHGENSVAISRSHGRLFSVVTGGKAFTSCEKKKSLEI